MSFAYSGLTHCKKCMKSLQMGEVYICNECEEKEKKKMSKIYKGYELMEKAMKGEINIHQKVNSLSEDYKNCTIKFVLNDSAINVMGLNFELIEDNTIDSIEELNDTYSCYYHNSETAWNVNEQVLALKINKLIQAVKQLKKEKRVEGEKQC